MKLSRQIFLAFSVVIFFSVIDSYTNYLLSQKVTRNIAFLSRSEAIIRNSSKLHKTIIEMQSGFRGFLLTSDTSFLDSYYSGINSIDPLFKEQEKLLEDKRQLDLLATIEKIDDQWIDYANSLISAKKKGDTSSAYNVLFETKLKKQVGKKMNDEIALLFSDFDKYEYKVRSQRREQLISSIRITRIFSLIFLLITISAGVVTTLYLIKLISERIASMVKMAENISEGDFGIIKDTRHDELTGLSSSLNMMSQKLSKNINELEKRNSELNQFAYVVSHDLKAPVRGIYNVIQWIEEDMGNELSPGLRKYLSIIPQRTKRMEDLINGLLDYARIREKTNPEIIDINDLVHEITDSIVPRDFIIETHDLPQVYSERLKLEQVFTNLISNAVKYITKRPGHIIISCKTLHDHYEFSVKDNGIGIDPEYHDKIFELFQTLRERHEKESTGIGLAIIKKIIDDRHGTIKVISLPGDGSTFIFTWPRNYTA